MKYFDILLISAVICCVLRGQPRRYTIENNQLKTATQVTFKCLKDILEVTSDSDLNEVKSFLYDKAIITLMRIECHIAAGGDEGKNPELKKTGKGFCCGL